MLILFEETNGGSKGLVTDVVGNCRGSCLPVCLKSIMLIPFNICALILLQTDSSPSLSFAQLAKVLFLCMLAVTPEKLKRWVVFFCFFLEGLTLF